MKVKLIEDPPRNYLTFKDPYLEKDVDNFYKVNSVTMLFQVISLRNSRNVTHVTYLRFLWDITRHRMFAGNEIWDNNILKKIYILNQVCQLHRLQYTNPDEMHALDYFNRTQFKYQCPSDLTSTYLKYPTYYLQYRHPLVLPQSLERTTRFPDLPERCLRGKYS